MTPSSVRETRGWRDTVANAKDEAGEGRKGIDDAASIDTRKEATEDKGGDDTSALE